MTSNVLEQVQRRILGLVIAKYPKVYLVGGTAISLFYHHRVSEDLDFFTQVYSRRLHKGIADFIGKETGFEFGLVDEEKRKQYVPMAVYEYRVTSDLILKIDFVSDYAPLLQPRQKHGIASVEDIYCRKIMAVIGWEAGRSGRNAFLS